MKSIFCVLAFSCSFALAGFTFEKLPADDAAFVTILRKSPDKAEGYELVFSRTNKMAVNVIEIEYAAPAKDKPLEEKSRVFLNSLIVSPEEVAGLDQLLAFYRTKPEGDCKTVDEISLVQKSGDKTREMESFTDSSCKTGEMKDITTLMSIVARAKGGK